MQVATSITEEWSPHACTIEIELNPRTINALQLDITPAVVRAAIAAQRKLKIDEQDIIIAPRRPGRPPRLSVIVEELDPPKNASMAAKPRPTTTPVELHPRSAALMRALPDVVLSGYPECARAVITQNEHAATYCVLVEGYGLRACMATTGVRARHTTTNSVLETRDVLGIEAARKCIVDEMAIVLRDMDIDPRHLALLADVMTQRGEVLGITRFGLARMRDSVLQLASFEKTPDHLFEAAAHGLFLLL